MSYFLFKMYYPLSRNIIFFNSCLKVNKLEMKKEIGSIRKFESFTLPYKNSLEQDQSRSKSRQDLP